jgi:hypothetical protein
MIVFFKLIPHCFPYWKQYVSCMVLLLRISFQPLVMLMKDVNRLAFSF